MNTETHTPGVDRIELNITSEDLKTFSLDKLINIYEATFGLIPNRKDKDFVAILSRELQFDRQLYIYQ